MPDTVAACIAAFEKKEVARTNILALDRIRILALCCRTTWEFDVEFGVEVRHIARAVHRPWGRTAIAIWFAEESAAEVDEFVYKRKCRLTCRFLCDAIRR